MSRSPAVRSRLRSAVARVVHSLVRRGHVELERATARAEALENRRLLARATGIDVSSHSGTVNWSQVAGAGYTFAYARATEGVGFTDAQFANNLNSAGANGLLMGVYHHATPSTAANDAINEANYFVSAAGGALQPGYLRPALDVSEGAGGTGLTKAQLSTWVNAFLDRVKATTGVEPIVYTNNDYATNYLDGGVAANRDLWIARWSTTFGDPLTTGSPPTGTWAANGETWDFWQHTNAGTVPGISGSVDRDVFNGDRSALETFVIGGTTPSFSAKLDFGPAGATVPAGYLNVSGDLFGTQGGQQMGWLQSGVTTYTRTAGAAADIRYRTYAMPALGGVSRAFEIVVPNGSYSVRVVAGSPDQYPNAQKITVEGITAVNATTSSTTPFVTGTVTVNVTDGRLTLGSDYNGWANTRLAYVDITSIDPLAATGVQTQVTFGEEGRGAVGGYFNDFGEAYGLRRSGDTFGWLSSPSGSPTSNGGATFARSGSNDRRRSQGIAFGGKTWAMAVPNGTYWVKLVAGDAALTGGTYGYDIEGQSFLRGTASGTGEGRWVTAEATVTVTDGRLTITKAAGMANDAVAYLEITDFSARSRTALVAPSNVVATSAGDNVTDIRWTDRSDNETGFRVERATSAAGPWTLVSTTYANASVAGDGTGDNGGTYYYRVTAIQGSVSSSAPVLSNLLTTPVFADRHDRSPYNPTRANWSATGTIQAEDYDVSGNFVAYDDTTGGNAGGYYRSGNGDIGYNRPDARYFVGWTKQDEWNEYTVNVLQGGIYRLEARVASPGLGGRFALKVDGLPVTSGIQVPDTGSFNTYETVTSGTFSLTAGSGQVLRLTATDDNASGSWVGDVDWFKLVKVDVTTPPTGGPTGSFVAPPEIDEGSIANMGFYSVTGKGPLTYRFEHGGDVRTSSTKLMNIPASWLRDGDQTISINGQITDADGLAFNQTISVDVKNVAPTPIITSLPDTIEAGMPISLAGSAYDPGLDDQAAGIALVWTVRLDGNVVASLAGGLASFTPTSTTSTNYTVQLTAIDRDGASKSTAEVPLAGTVAGPAAGIASFNGVAISPSSIQLNWTKTSGEADTYELEYAQNDYVFSALRSGPATANGYTLNGLSAASNFRFRVRLVNDGVPSAWSQSFSVNTPSGTDVLSGAVGAGITCDAVVIKWSLEYSPTKALPAAGFHLSYAEVDPAHPDDLNFVSAGDGNYSRKTFTALVKGLKADTKYVFRVLNGSTGYAVTTGVVRTLPVPTFAKPHGVVPTVRDIDGKAVTFTWDYGPNEAQEVDGYAIWDHNGFAGIVPVTQHNYTAFVFGDASSSYFRVEAYNAAGFSSTGQIGFPVSGVVEKQVPPPAPTSITLENLGSLINAVWSQVPTADGYIFQYSNDPNFGDVASGANGVRPPANSFQTLVIQGASTHNTPVPSTGMGMQYATFVRVAAYKGTMMSGWITGHEPDSIDRRPPSAPRVTTESLPDGLVAIKFDEATGIPGGEPIQTLIQKLDQGEWKTIAEWTPGQTELVVSRQTSSDDHQHYRVLATNAYGKTPSNSPCRMTPPLEDDGKSGNNDDEDGEIELDIDVDSDNDGTAGAEDEDADEASGHGLYLPVTPQDAAWKSLSVRAVGEFNQSSAEIILQFPSSVRLWLADKSTPYVSGTSINYVTAAAGMWLEGVALGSAGVSAKLLVNGKTAEDEVAVTTTMTIAWATNDNASESQGVRFLGSTGELESLSDEDLLHAYLGKDNSVNIDWGDGSTEAEVYHFFDYGRYAISVSRGGGTLIEQEVVVGHASNPFDAAPEPASIGTIDGGDSFDSDLSESALESGSPSGPDNLMQGASVPARPPLITDQLIPAGTPIERNVALSKADVDGRAQALLGGDIFVGIYDVVLVKRTVVQQGNVTKFKTWFTQKTTVFSGAKKDKSGDYVIHGDYAGAEAMLREVAAKQRCAVEDLGGGHLFLLLQDDATMDLKRDGDFGVITITDHSGNKVVVRALSAYKGVLVNAGNPNTEIDRIDGPDFQTIVEETTAAQSGFEMRLKFEKTKTMEDLVAEWAKKKVYDKMLNRITVINTPGAIVQKSTSQEEPYVGSANPPSVELLKRARTFRLELKSSFPALNDAIMKEFQELKAHLDVQYPGSGYNFELAVKS